MSACACSRAEQALWRARAHLQIDEALLRQGAIVRHSATAPRGVAATRVGDGLDSGGGVARPEGG